MEQKRKGRLYPVLSDGFRGLMAALTALLSTAAAQPLIAALLFFNRPPVLRDLENYFLGAAVSLIVLGFPLGLFYTSRSRRRKKDVPLTRALFTVKLWLLLTAVVSIPYMTSTRITLWDGLYLLITFFVFASVWTGIYDTMLRSTSPPRIIDIQTGTSEGDSSFLIKKRKD